MDRFYEESAADLMASYNRSRHSYETFGAPDDMDIEEKGDELAEPPTNLNQPELARANGAASDSTRRPK